MTSAQTEGAPLRILYLDPASQTGYAGNLGDDGEWYTGTVQVHDGKEPLWKAHLTLYSWLHDFLKNETVDIIAFERRISVSAPIKRQGKVIPQSEPVLVLPILLEQAIINYCVWHGENRGCIRWETVSVMTVRSKFIPGIRAENKEGWKRAMVERCRLLGLIPRDAIIHDKTRDPLLDECDAIGGLVYMLDRERVKWNRPFVLT